MNMRKDCGARRGMRGGVFSKRTLGAGPTRLNPLTQTGRVGWASQSPL
jgi:hypothetical protein